MNITSIPTSLPISQLSQALGQSTQMQGTPGDHRHVAKGGSPQSSTFDNLVSTITGSNASATAASDDGDDIAALTQSSAPNSQSPRGSILDIRV